MKLVKYLVTTAAITAVTAAMAVSASAAIELGADNDFTVSVNEETKKVSISDIAFEGTPADQMTVLILNNDATNVGEGDIEQIDQEAYATSWADLAMSELTVGQTYYIRIGGNGEILKASFKMTEDGPVYTLGDVNADTAIDGSDASLALQQFAKLITLDDTQKLAADVNIDDAIDGSDASLMLQYFAKLITEF